MPIDMYFNYFSPLLGIKAGVLFCIHQVIIKLFSTECRNPWPSWSACCLTTSPGPGRCMRWQTSTWGTSTPPRRSRGSCPERRQGLWSSDWAMNSFCMTSSRGDCCSSTNIARNESILFYLFLKSVSIKVTKVFYLIGSKINKYSQPYLLAGMEDVVSLRYCFPFTLYTAAETFILWSWGGLVLPMRSRIWGHHYLSLTQTLTPPCCRPPPPPPPQCLCEAGPRCSGHWAQQTPGPCHYWPRRCTLPRQTEIYRHLEIIMSIKKRRDK